MNDTALIRRRFETSRHRTAYIEAGPVDGPLMVFLHGWPELAIFWRAQLEHFAARGWHCVAPDMRGYGESAVPAGTEAYAVREIVADMLELHDALGGAPALWIGHDWGSPIVWSIAANHADRVRGVASLCVPYQPLGFALANLIPLIDRELYPIDAYPVGQWDYFLFYRENFNAAARDFEADVTATLGALLRSGSDRALGNPAITAGVRARGGWFGEAHRAPDRPRDREPSHTGRFRRVRRRVYEDRVSRGRRVVHERRRERRVRARSSERRTVGDARALHSRFMGRRLRDASQQARRADARSMRRSHGSDGRRRPLPDARESRRDQCRDRGVGRLRRS